MDAKTLLFWIGFLILVYLIVSFEAKNQGPSLTATNLGNETTNLLGTLQGR